MTEGTRSVLVASSDRLFAEATAVLFDGRAGWRTAAVASDGVAAVAAAARHRPDAVLLTEQLRRLSVAATVAQIRRRLPETAVVALGDVEAPGATVLPIAADARAVLAAMELPAEMATAAGREEDSLRRITALTRQELRVLRLLAEGKSSADIAAQLRVRANTVRTHMQNLYAKLGCHNRTDVIRVAVRHGLLTRENDGG